MQRCSAGRLIRLQGIVEGYGERAKYKGHWMTRKKNAEFTSFVIKLPG